VAMLDDETLPGTGCIRRRREPDHRRKDRHPASHGCPLACDTRTSACPGRRKWRGTSSVLFFFYGARDRRRTSENPRNLRRAHPRLDIRPIAEDSASAPVPIEWRRLIGSSPIGSSRKVDARVSVQKCTEEATRLCDQGTSRRDCTDQEHHAGGPSRLRAVSRPRFARCQARCVSADTGGMRRPTAAKDVVTF